MTSRTLSTFARSSRSVSSRSTDSLDTLHRLACKATETAAPLRGGVPRLPQVDTKTPPVSRLELLLSVPRKLKPVFTPEEDSATCQAVNKAIKLSSQWTEVRDAILDAPNLTASNLAFSLYRLGCISAYDSRKRRNDLRASELVPAILDLALGKLKTMEPSSLVLVLDGCARLQHTPSTNDLNRMSHLIRQHAMTLDARQLPLVLWSFSSLLFKPGSETLRALEHAVTIRAADMHPQGVALVLSGFQAAQHALNQPTMHQLADIIQRKVLLFKPSELATCLKALAAMGHKPTPTFIQAIAERTGQTGSMHSHGALRTDTGSRLSVAF